MGGWGRPCRRRLEAGNERGARRARRRIRPVDRVQSNEPVLGLSYFELEEPPSLDIPPPLRFGHIPPADALLQQHGLRAKIGQAPGLRADHSEILPLRERRALSKHKL